MIKRIDHLDLKQTACSGQCFRWKEIGENRFNIVAFGKSLDIQAVEGETELFDLSCNEEEWESIWSSYFDMDTDYNHIEKLIRESGDAHLIEAYEMGSGIRILRQDLWEMVISYLISQNNNITRIRRSIDTLCTRCGYIANGSGEGVHYRFPTPSDTIPEGLFDDASLGLGYRNVYLKEMFEFAQMNPDWLINISAMDYETARNALLERKGIGPKVADCISLFGLHHIEAFPIDTHVKQLLAKYYQNGFDFEYFEGVAGIIQQYLFYYELQNSK